MQPHVTDTPNLETAPPQPAPNRSGVLLRNLRDLLLITLVLHLAVNVATARAIVEGHSMSPTLETGQMVLVNRMAYLFGRPERGDVVVLRDPGGQNESLIKRVVGLPGEQIEILAGTVYINGIEMQEPYLRNYCELGCDNVWRLASDEYFVLGDNRPFSRDSSKFGPIKYHLIMGKAWLRYSPISQLMLISHPRYEGLP
jgi:signal peptidase I